MKYLMTLFLLFSISQAFADEVRFDVVLWEGGRYFLFANPLGMDYYEQENFITNADKKRVYFKDSQYFIPPVPLLSISRTNEANCYEIYNNQLFLRKVVAGDTPAANPPAIPVDWLREIDMIHLDWYSGYLIFDDIDIVNHTDYNYNGVFRGFIILEIRGGTVINTSRMDSTQFNSFVKSQFEKYQQTEDYKKWMKFLDQDNEAYELLFMLVGQYILLLYD